MGETISFRVVNMKTNARFEIHCRMEKSKVNILRPSVKGILADGLRRKANMSREAAACASTASLIKHRKAKLQKCKPFAHVRTRAVLRQMT